ncbi:MAG: chemotaxis protein CheD [Faecalibacterium sp.]|jgi:chemotaxis protein CheD|nr:chemotaxis protein CheD [Faecalibacterium sp.]
MIEVGISDLHVAVQDEVLVTRALGSCVGVCLYDSAVKVAGLSHIMLPDSKPFAPVEGRQLYKFADTALPALVEKMEEKGAVRTRIKAKIAGGAQMFACAANSSLASIGQRNILAVKITLLRLHIPILAEDTGKDYGRTQIFSAADGVMQIKSVIKGEWKY